MSGERPRLPFASSELALLLTLIQGFCTSGGFRGITSVIR